VGKELVFAYHQEDLGSFRKKNFLNGRRVGKMGKMGNLPDDGGAKYEG
jgi:hypothetical protein